MYKIGELSKLCKIPAKTLRYYDSEGLLIPDIVNSFTGYRYYSADKLNICNRILILKELGFTLAEIKMHLYAKSNDELSELIRKKVKELTILKEQTELQLKRLNDLKAGIDAGVSGLFHVVMKEPDTIRVVYKRDIYNTKAMAYDNIDEFRDILPENIKGSRVIIINYDTEYCDKDFDLAACVEIKESIQKKYGFQEMIITIPSLAASLICKREELDEAYYQMGKVLEEYPCQIIGPFYEVYYEDNTVELMVPVCQLSQENDCHRDDEIVFPFEKDDVIGKWEYVDSVPSYDQFNLSKIKTSHGVWLNELYFLPNGEGYWGISGWTKGYLFTRSDCPKREYANKYSIRNINSDTFMFIEMKEYEYEARGGKPNIWVYKRVSNQEYIKNDIRIMDNVELAFINDSDVIGKWVVRDFVLTMEEFDPTKQNFSDDMLFLRSLEFYDNGFVASITRNNPEKPYQMNWTKGTVIDKRDQTTPAYSIKNMNGTDYMFYEWKSGDYVFGGNKPYYYILMRQ